ncbi:MAG: glycoside hydrolase family 15 protein, partial [Rhodomicrobium sp.]
MRARRYQSDTLVLETDFETESGAARVIDFMAGNHGLPLLFRLVLGLRGRCRMQSKLNLKFDYGGVA